MIWTIARKEFLLNLMTFKFAVGMLLCVVLVGVFVPRTSADKTVGYKLEISCRVVTKTNTHAGVHQRVCWRS